MPSLADIASILLGYAFLGRADVMAAVRTSPLKKPLWAIQPSWRTLLLQGATWPAGHIVRAYFGSPPNKRAQSVVIEILKVAGSWLFMIVMFSLAFGAATFFHESVVLRIAVFVVAWNVLLPLASWVSQARRVFPPRTDQIQIK